MTYKFTSVGYSFHIELLTSQAFFSCFQPTCSSTHVDIQATHLIFHYLLYNTQKYTMHLRGTQIQTEVSYPYSSFSLKMNTSKQLD